MNAFVAVHKPAQSPAFAPSSKMLWALRIIAALALVVSGYLAWMGFATGDVAGCGVLGMDCDSVLASSWAKWFGLPVGALAVSVYLTLTFTLAFAGPLTPINVRLAAWRLSTWLIYAAAAAGVWFVGLQFFAVEGLCPWCLVVHLCAAAMAILAAISGREAASQKLVAMGVGVACALIFAGGQWIQPQPEREMAIEQLEGAPTTSPVRLEVTALKPTVDESEGETLLQVSKVDKPVEGKSAEQDTSPPANNSTSQPKAAQQTGARQQKRLVSVYVGNGKVAEVDIFQHPSLGSTKAEHVIVALFDYTCPDCREMHGHLEAACERFGDKLAVLLLPSPLNPDCNSQVPHRIPKHADACQLASLALAVWQSDATKFAEFDHWLFDPKHPPSVQDARRKAAELVGEQRLKAAMADWQLTQRLSVGTELYKMAGAGAIPKLLLPKTKLTGPADGREKVIQSLARDLGIQYQAPGPVDSGASADDLVLP